MTNFKSPLLLALSFASMLCQAQWIDLTEPDLINAGLGATFYFQNGDEGVADFCCGKIARTLDGGSTWNLAGTYTTVPNGGYWHLIKFSPDGSYGVALGSVQPAFGYVMFISQDGGATWTPGPSPAFPGIGLSLDVPAPGVIILSSSFDWAQSNDGGQTWTTIAALTTCIDFIDDQHGFRSQLAPTEFSATQDGGLSWTTRMEVALARFTFADQQHGIALSGASHDILTTSDGGVSWQTTLIRSTPTYSFIDFSIHASGFAIAAERDTQLDESHVYLSNDFGQSWTEHTPPIQEVSTVQAADQGVAYLVADNDDWWRWSGPVGIAEVEKQEELVIMPNPTQGAVSVNKLGKHAQSTLVVYSAQGKSLKTYASNTPKFEISLEEYPSGLYFIALHSMGHTSVGSIVRE